MALLSTLSKAETVAKPATGGKSARAEIELAGLANYAALSAVKTQIEGLMKTHPAAKLAASLVMSEGRRLKKKPDSPSARDGDTATASIQIRRRNSAQPLDVETAALCDDLGLETVKHIVVPHTMRIKPALFATLSEAQQDKIILAGAKALGMAPGDVFEEQDEESKRLVSDKTLDDLFALGDNHTDDRVLAILGKVCTSGGATIAPKFLGTLGAAFEIARVELAPTPAEMKAREAAAAAAATAKPDVAPNAGSDLMGALKASLAEEAGDIGVPHKGKRG